MSHSRYFWAYFVQFGDKNALEFKALLECLTKLRVCYKAYDLGELIYFLRKRAWHVKLIEFVSLSLSLSLIEYSIHFS